MSISNLIADTNMDSVIVDLSEDECTENNTEIKPKDGGTVITSSEQNNANDEQIDWDLLEMETDQEEVKSQKETQSSDCSLLLLEVGSDALLLSSREKGLGADVGENGDNCQCIFVSSNESKIGYGNDNLDLGLNVSEKSDLLFKGDENSAIIDAEEKEIVEKKEEFVLSGADNNEIGYGNDNLDLGLNVSEKSDLLFKGDEKSAIADAEEKEIVEKKEEYVLSGAENNEIGKEDREVLDINEELNVDRNQSLGEDLSSHKVSEIDNEGGLNENSAPDVCADNSNINEDLNVDRNQSLGEDLSGHKVSEIENTGVLNENSAPDACADNSMCLGSGEAHDNCVLKEGVVDVKVSIEDIDMCSAENNEKDSCEELMDPGKLNLDGVIVNQNSLKSDLEMKDLESSMNTSVHGTTVGTNTVPGTNMKQAEHIQPSVDDANKDFSLNSGSAMDPEKLNLDGVIVNQNIITVDLEMNDLDSAIDTGVQATSAGASAVPGTNIDQTETNDHAEHIQPSEDTANKDISLISVPSNDINEIKGSLPDNKPSKKRGRPRKTPGSTENVVVHNNGERSSGSRKLRKRYKSWIRKGPYIMFGACKQVWSEKENITGGEENEGSNRDSKKAKKLKFSEKTVRDLLCAARSVLHPKSSVLGKSTMDFLTSFRDWVANAPPPVLIDARDKMEGVIMSLQESDLEEKESLIRDVKGVLEKVELMLAKSTN